MLDLCSVKKSCRSKAFQSGARHSRDHEAITMEQTRSILVKTACSAVSALEEQACHDTMQRSAVGRGSNRDPADLNAII